TNPDKPKYRPLFLEHFDKKETAFIGNAVNFINEEPPKMVVPPKPTFNATPAAPSPEAIAESPVVAEPQAQPQVQHHFVNVPVASAPTDVGENLLQQIHQQQQQQQYANDNMIRRMHTMDSEYEFVSEFLNFQGGEVDSV
ncbi:hypothetical protein GRW02_25840, partial [Escherichia coli]|nr:hypothetical protein [Escherichia coli]